MRNGLADVAKDLRAAELEAKPRPIDDEVGILIIAFVDEAIALNMEGGLGKSWS